MINELAELALGTRLKRMSERLMGDVNRIYAHYRLPFESRWFPVFYLLSKGKMLSIMEMADRTHLSHPAIIQTVTEMSQASLVVTTHDPRDKRKRFVEMTPAGRELLTRLSPVWERIASANRNLLKELDVQLLADLKRMEGALDKKDMFTRVCGQVQPAESEVSILRFRSAYRDTFRELNYEWLRKYFTVEPQDRKLLGDPENEIINKGGSIFMARYRKSLVGTCALIRREERSYELTKMAVTESAQGLGIGRKLADHAIAFAKKKGAQSVVLETNPTLRAAVKLYRTLGFKEARSETPSKYRRSTFTMRLDLK